MRLTANIDPTRTESYDNFSVELSVINRVLDQVLESERRAISYDSLEYDTARLGIIEISPIS